MKRTLSLTRETLNELTNDELAHVVGGEATATCTCKLFELLSLRCPTDFCPTE